MTAYYAMSANDKAVINNLARELISSRLIVKNCTSSCACTYLKENYFVDAKNYPLTIVATVALIASLRVNSGRTCNGNGDKYLTGNIEIMVRTPGQYHNANWTSPYRLYMGCINRGDMSTNDDRPMGMTKRGGSQ